MPTYEEQLEQCLVGAREMIAEGERKYEAAHREWLQERSRLMQRIQWLESQAVKDIVNQSKVN